MSTRPPDFDELVGSDVESAERERLQRVHDLLVAAGPPPELGTRLSTAPSAGRRIGHSRRRAAILALAATLGAAIFGVGYLVASSDRPSTDRVVAMTGSGGASASLEIFEADKAGNWPMELRVDGLGPSAGGGLYQLWLTMNGELAALCGSFLAERDGSTVVPMNAPWKLDDFDGWVVVEQGKQLPLLST